MNNNSSNFFFDLLKHRNLTLTEIYNYLDPTNQNFFNFEDFQAGLQNMDIKMDKETTRSVFRILSRDCEIVPKLSFLD